MRRLTTLEDENARLKKVVVDLTLDREMLQRSTAREKSGGLAPLLDGKQSNAGQGSGRCGRVRRGVL